MLSRQIMILFPNIIFFAHTIATLDSFVLPLAAKPMFMTFEMKIVLKLGSTPVHPDNCFEFLLCEFSVYRHTVLNRMNNIRKGAPTNKLFN